MTETPSIDSALDEIERYLKKHSGRLRVVASHWNGFEGWLKFELSSAFQQKFQVRPWEPDGEKWKDGDIGVEHRYRRAARGPTPEAAKLVDLWLGNKPTLYFELKVAFRNNNAGKQLQSWRADFEKLTVVLDGDKTVAGFASVLVAVGHSDPEWQKALAMLGDDERLRASVVLSSAEPDRIGVIRMVSLRTDLSPSE